MMEKRQVLQQMVLGKLTSAYRKLMLDPCLSLSTNVNPKWIKVLYVRPEILKLQERLKTWEQIGICDNFLNRMPIAIKRNDWKNGNTWN
jgi:hypothetical protein